MTVPDAKRLKDLELENSWLKKAVGRSPSGHRVTKGDRSGEKGKPDSAAGGGAGDASQNRHL